MTKHAYLATTIISDKGSAFVSQVIKEVADDLGITLEHATTKHEETIEMLESTHASSRKAFKNETGERRSMWQKCVNLAVLDYNTSYYTGFRCDPSQALHRRLLSNALDLKIVICPQEQSTHNSQIAQEILEQTEKILQDVSQNAM